MRQSLSPAGLLKIFEAHPAQAFRLRQLLTKLGLRSSEARELKAALRRLAGEKKIIQQKQNQFMLAKQFDFHAPAAHAAQIGRHSQGAPPFHTKGPVGISAGVITGRLIGHRDGFGFVVPDAQAASQDIFIPPGAMASAMHGDRVEVRVVKSKRDGRLEGRIHRVIDRAQKTVVGEFHYGARFNYVKPFDHRIPQEIVIPSGHERPPEGRELASHNRQFGGESEGRGASRRERHAATARPLENLIVDVEITKFALPGGGNPSGRVTEILGKRDDFGVDVEIMIRKFHLPHRFPPEVLKTAADQLQIISETERAGRRDFRHLPIVTIDGETAKDFDDAVYVERLTKPNGARYLLQVHIADVAHYVRPGTPLDREARLRGTSVYFPDRAVPMLPLELSNGICSLNPRVDRLAMSALMEIDSTGKVVDYEIAPGIIRSAERMTYTAVRDVLAGDPAAGERYRPLVENFKLMEELAKVLNRRRDQRGSIDFDLPEPEIEFDEHGRMIGVTRSERNMAHRLIEEFMLAANETVAEFLERRGVPSLFRIHEKPDPKKVLEFEEIAATFGYSLGVEQPAARRHRVERQGERDRHPRFHDELEAGDLKITPHHYQRLTERIAGKPEERILSYLMLRSLKQARYSEENVGHFALASGTYTHFTSPIRRYPDLVVHRLLKSVLDKSDPAGISYPIADLHALGLETSEAERRAADAERELMEWKKTAFMAERMGEEFDALIISLTKHGCFVELVDLFVEGFVPLDSFEDDRYVYREKMRALVAERSKHAYSLGGRVRVRLEGIERVGNKLQFSMVN